MFRWNERDLFNDEGVIVRRMTNIESLPAGASMRHPDAQDDVLITFKAKNCNGVIFDKSEGAEWITLGSGRLPAGAECALVREGMKGATMEVDLAHEYAFGACGKRPQVLCNESVSYTIELHDWNTVRDMHDDGSVMVRLYGQSDDMYAYQCKDACKVDVWVSGRTANGSVFLQNSSYSNLSIGGRTVPEAVEEAMTLLRQDQKAVVTVKPARTLDDAESGMYAYGKQLKGETEWTIKVTAVRRPYQLSAEEKAEAAG